MFFRKPKERHGQRRRALGQLLDRGGLRSLRIIEQPGRIVFQGVPGGILRRGYQTHWLTVEQLRGGVCPATRRAADPPPGLA